MPRDNRTVTPEPAPPRSWPALLAACAVFLLVAVELDPTGTFDWLPPGPGLTVDEVLNTQQGVRTAIGLRAWLSGEVSWAQLFGHAAELGPDAPLGYHAHDYPPLGRYLIGLAHAVVTTFAYPSQWETPFIIAAARFGSAIAFAATFWLIVRFGASQFSPLTGWTAGVALLLMPRLFGHAHLASLETMTGLFYAITFLAIARRWRPAQPISNAAAALAGFLWGLALLVKIQAILIPLPVTLWAFYYWRLTAFRPLAIMALVGLATFFLGWPWLWFDPLNHFWEYFAQTTDRATLPVWYMGQVWSDKKVPWHYPWIMTFATTPLVLLLLAAWGLLGGTPLAWRDPRFQLITGGILTPLVLFSLPGVAVYDGSRLFLVIFPLLALLIGHGAQHAWKFLQPRFGTRPALLLASLALAGPLLTLATTRPVYLSAYGWSVGGLAGADALGFERNYWADALTTDFVTQAVEAIPEGGTLAISPILHPFQLDDLRTQTPLIRARNLRLVEWGTPEAQAANGLLIYERLASLPPRLVTELATRTPRATLARQGVVLAAFYDELPPSDSTP